MRNSVLGSLTISALLRAAMKHVSKKNGRDQQRARGQPTRSLVAFVALDRRRSLVVVVVAGGERNKFEVAFRVAVAGAGGVGVVS